MRSTWAKISKAGQRSVLLRCRSAPDHLSPSRVRPTCDKCLFVAELLFGLLRLLPCTQAEAPEDLERRNAGFFHIIECGELLAP